MLVLLNLSSIFSYSNLEMMKKRMLMIQLIVKPKKKPMTKKMMMNNLMFKHKMKSESLVETRKVCSIIIKVMSN